MQNWTVIEGRCATDGAEGYPTYGVRMTASDGSCWEWEDVDTDPAVAAALACRLQAIRPEPCHFQELVLDFIEEMAAKV